MHVQSFAQARPGSQLASIYRDVLTHDVHTCPQRWEDKGPSLFHQQHVGLMERQRVAEQALHAPVQLSGVHQLMAGHRSLASAGPLTCAAVS